MPQFFFHYHTPDDVSRDDMGCAFDTLDLAYLDAYRSLVDIGSELLKAHKNPNGHWIEITDGAGQLLMELSFDEVYRRRSPLRPSSLHVHGEAFRKYLDKARKLRIEIEIECAAARASVARAHEVLRRARADADAAF